MQEGHAGLRAAGLGRTRRYAGHPPLTHGNLGAPAFMQTPSQTPCPPTPIRNPLERVLGNGDKWFVKQRQRKGQGESTTFPQGL